DERVRRVHMDVAPAGHAPLARIRLNLRRIAKLRRLLSRSRPDAVLSFISESNVLTLLAGARLGLRVVISERIHPGRDVTVSAVWRVLRKITYGWSDEVVAQTRAAAVWI